MENVYLPINNFASNRCYVILNSQTIRVYQDAFVLGNNNYTDYYIKSHYLQKNGVDVFDNVNQYPTCESVDAFTNEIEYRFDYLEILGCATLLFFITAIIPYLVFRRFFGRWLKV